MNPFRCSVCTDPETSENQIASCEKCGVNVHMLCYGIESFAQDWKCSPCGIGNSDARCTLCLGKGGALKKTSCGKWSHVICALFTAGVDFEDKDSMEPINVSNLTNARRNKTCVFCQKSHGFCGLCATSKCKNRLHITCAQKNQCLKEQTNPNDASIKFRAFCTEHKPKGSSRRISSQFVPEVLAEKKKKKQLQQIEKEEKDVSAKKNAEWLVRNPFANRSVKPLTETPESLIEKQITSLNNTFVQIVASPNNPSIQSTPNNSIVALEAEIDSTKISVAHHSNENKTSKTDKEKNKGTPFGNISDSLISESIDLPLGKRKAESNSTEVAIVHRPKKNKASKAEREKTIDTRLSDLTGNMSRKSLLWDSMDLHLGSNKENIINFDHSCLKDEKIIKLKNKNAKMKEKLKKSEDMNIFLQQELLEAKMSRSSQPQLGDNDRNIESNKDVIRTLKKRIAMSLSEDGNKLVFPNEVSICSKLAKQLEVLNSEPSSDRLYINTAFFVLFPEKHIKKQVKNGLSREQTLKNFRDSARHDTMKDLYDHRVLSNGKGDVASRLKMFKLVFRSKLNNWWLANAHKVKVKSQPDAN